MKLPPSSHIAGYLILIAWAFLGLYGAYHVVSDRTESETLAFVESHMQYLVCYRVQRELARDSLPATSECVPPDSE